MEQKTFEEIKEELLLRAKKAGQTRCRMAVQAIALDKR